MIEGVVSAPQSKPFPGPKVLLLGPAGTGKTYSLGTLGDWCQAHGKTLFVLFTDNSADSFVGYWKDKGKDVPAAVHWHSQMVKPLSLTQIIDRAQKVGTMSYELLTKMTDPNRGGENNAFWKILGSCAAPVSDKDGTKFPPVDSWGPDKIFAIDGMTELSNAAMSMQVGNKPTAAPPDYGVAQTNLMGFLRLCTQGSQHGFVLIAHPSREKDEISGSTKIQVNTVGSAICGEIPPMFGDVIYTVREGDKFYWDTAAYGVDTKTRSLGYRSKIDPNFAAIMDLWQKRGGV